MNAHWIAHRYRRLADATDGAASITDWLCHAGEELLAACAVDAPRRGIYVLTQDGGVDTSIRFWRDSLRTGPALASPRLFPQTLANFVATRLAAAVDARGPNVTLVGDGGELPALFEHAFDDMADAHLDVALVAAADLRDQQAAIVLLAAPTLGLPAFAPLASIPAAAADRPGPPYPGHALYALCQRLELEATTMECLAPGGGPLVQPGIAQLRGSTR